MNETQFQYLMLLLAGVGLFLGGVGAFAIIKLSTIVSRLDDIHRILGNIAADIFSENWSKK